MLKTCPCTESSWNAKKNDITKFQEQQYTGIGNLEMQQSFLMRRWETKWNIIIAWCIWCVFLLLSCYTSKLWVFFSIQLEINFLVVSKNYSYKKFNIDSKSYFSIIIFLHKKYFGKRSRWWWKWWGH